jgi:hypothetical protein
MQAQNDTPLRQYWRRDILANIEAADEKLAAVVLFGFY